MRIGLLGFGVVGRGFYDITATRDDIQVAKVVCLEEVSLPDAEVTKDFQSVLNDPAIDTVVEAMGGLHPAYEFVKASIEAGKHIVTSNKALVATFYDELIPLAKEKGIYLVGGSIPELWDGKVYNTAMVFDRSGACIASYDKTHLFTPMGEDQVFTPGDSLCRFTLDGISCAILICYDIRFPELTRTMCLDGMDVLFVVCQWPRARIGLLQTLCAARAIENLAARLCGESVPLFAGLRRLRRRRLVER